MSTDVRTRAGLNRIPWSVVVAIVIPLAGLGLLLARPELDLEWEHHPSHFWLVLVTAGVNVVLAYVTNVAAGRYRDARLVLISLAFLSSAGFLGLHALATPGVLLEQPNAGFVIATPMGLVSGRPVRGRVGQLHRGAWGANGPPDATGAAGRSPDTDGRCGGACRWRDCRPSMARLRRRRASALLHGARRRRGRPVCLGGMAVVPHVRQRGGTILLRSRSR